MPHTHNSFPPSLRIVHQQDFRTAFNNAKKYYADNVLIITKPNQLTVPRLGLIIGKKYLKKAVDRNTVKRVIRESFRYHQSLLCGLDCFIFARKGLANLSKKALRQQLDEQWQKCQKS